MSRNPAPLEHVKYVKARGQWYAYFNTGQRKDGKPIYAPLPKPHSVGFWDSYAAHKAVRTKRSATAYSVAQLVGEYFEGADFAKLADASQRLYRIQLAKVTNVLGEFPVNDLHPADVRAAIEAERYPPATANAFLSSITALYAWARRHGKTELRPTADIEREKIGTHQPWPEAILQAALASDDSDVRLAVHLLYFTGQRIGDVCCMRWNHISDGAVEVRQEKTGKRLHVPLHSQLAQELQRTPKRGLTILADEFGKPFRTQRLRRLLQAFTKDQGEETVPHGLRKNAVNSLLMAGCTIAEVASITGQTFQMVEHYAKHIEQKGMSKAAMLKFERRTQSEQESAGKTRRGKARKC